MKKLHTIFAVAFMLSLSTLTYAQTLLDFDNVATTCSGYVDATSYLAASGITISNVSPGTTAVQIANDCAIYDGDAVIPPSAPNVLSQFGANGPVSYRLNFATALTSFSFKRSGLFAGPSGITHPAWTVRAFNSSDVQIAIASEGQIASFSDVPAASFTLDGPGISYVSVEADNVTTAFSSVVLDDFIICSGVGIDELITENSFIAYPNPFTNELKLNNIDSGEVVLYDLMGKEMLRQKISDGETKLNAEKISAGFYLLIYTDRNKIENFKVVKN